MCSHMHICTPSARENKWSYRYGTYTPVRDCCSHCHIEELIFYGIVMLTLYCVSVHVKYLGAPYTHQKSVATLQCVK